MTKLHRTFLFVAVTTALASALSLIGGIGLEYISDRVLPLVPLIIAIPGLNDLVGDYASIIAAHTGDPKESGRRTKRALAVAIAKVIGVNIIAIIVLSVGGALLRGYELNGNFLIRFVIFVAGAAILTVSLMFAVANALEIILKRKHVNPDELLIPIITALADIVMLLMVTLAVLTIFK